MPARRGGPLGQGDGPGAIRITTAADPTPPRSAVARPSENRLHRLPAFRAREQVEVATRTARNGNRPAHRAPLLDRPVRVYAAARLSLVVGLATMVRCHERSPSTGRAPTCRMGAHAQTSDQFLRAYAARIAGTPAFPVLSSLDQFTVD